MWPQDSQFALSMANPGQADGHQTKPDTHSPLFTAHQAATSWTHLERGVPQGTACSALEGGEASSPDTLGQAGAAGGGGHASSRPRLLLLESRPEVSRAATEPTSQRRTRGVSPDLAHSSPGQAAPLPTTLQRHF